MSRLSGRVTTSAVGSCVRALEFEAGPVPVAKGLLICEGEIILVVTAQAGCLCTDLSGDAPAIERAIVYVLVASRTRVWRTVKDSVCDLIGGLFHPFHLEVTIPAGNRQMCSGDRKRRLRVHLCGEA